MENNDKLWSSVSKIQVDLAGLKAELTSQTATLQRVEEQTKKTNGRVTSLEGFQQRHEEWHRGRQESEDNADRDYRNPIKVGIIVGVPLCMISLIGEWIMHVYG